MEFYLKRSKKRGGFLKRGLEIVLTRDNSERKRRERERELLDVDRGGKRGKRELLYSMERKRGRARAM